jgi:hypothetical protein
VYYTATNIEQQHAVRSPQPAARSPQHAVRRPSDGVYSTNIEQQHAARSPQCGGPATECITKRQILSSSTQHAVRRPSEWERIAHAQCAPAVISRYVRLNFTQLGMPTEIPL